MPPKNISPYVIEATKEGVIYRVTDGGRTPLNQRPNGKYGYLSVYVGQGKRKYVHRLVAQEFLDNPDNLSDVDHIDGDVKNNNVSNLRWVSHADNMKLQRERKPYCKRGHLRFEDGRIDSNGRWLCYKCQRIRDRQKYRRKIERERPA